MDNSQYNEPTTEQILLLAAIIREVNGANKLGAAALAEAILEHPDFKSSYTTNPIIEEAAVKESVRYASQYGHDEGMLTAVKMMRMANMARPDLSLEQVANMIETQALYAKSRLKNPLDDADVPQ